MKVLLILVDGMRPDSLPDIPAAQDMIRRSASSMTARTVMPSVTLPCHMSLFHSVEPSRHGTTTNTYAPQVRPIRGLCEVLSQNGKRCAFFFDWEQLRDLTRPGTLDVSCFTKGESHGYAEADRMMTDAAISCLADEAPDFAFLYLGNPDEVGHRHGWMSEEYHAAVRGAWEQIRRVLPTLPEEYAVIILADHGGHDRIHGTEAAEDMTIPVMLCGKPFPAGTEIENVSILDIAPTIAAFLDTAADREWEGKSLAQ